MAEEYKVYGTAQFYVEEGMYSIAELEQLIHDLKDAKKLQDAALRKSLEAQNG